jgi:hypothetical protein
MRRFETDALTDKQSRWAARMLSAKREPSRPNRWRGLSGVRVAELRAGEREPDARQVVDERQRGAGRARVRGADGRLPNRDRWLQVDPAAYVFGEVRHALDSRAVALRLSHRLFTLVSLPRSTPTPLSNERAQVH